MSIVVVADSTCDLPQKYFKHENIEILPLDLIIDGEKYLDLKDPIEMAKFFSEEHITKMHNAESKAVSVESFRDYFLHKIVTKYDFALVLCASKGRSKTFENAVQASHLVNREYHSYRESSGMKGNFSMRVINTGTLFSGQGVIVSHMMKLIEEGMPKNELRRTAEAFKPFIYTYCVPKDLYYLRTRAKAKGDKSVGFLSAVIGKALDITPVILGYMDETNPVAKIKGYDSAVNAVFALAQRQMFAGLKANRICISYAGNVNDLKKFESFIELLKACRAKKVIIDIAVMSIAGGINLGPGTLTLAFASEPHSFTAL